MKVSFLTPAQQELDEAIAWYAAQAPGLGDTFLAEMRKTLMLIARHPLAWHKLSQETRRCRLRRFPFSVVYCPTEDEVLVIAIAHQRRRPSYWRGRL
jgi:plasmid stabilization system protein ParE